MFSRGPPCMLPFVTTSSTDQRRWRLRPPTSSDRERWGVLYRGYAEFYKVDQTDAAADIVWGWLMDPDHELRCLLAEDAGGHVVGLAHYRPYANPLTAGTDCFLDDLFVDPASRGSGAADALLTELRTVAAANGWSVVTWLTADDNYRGRAKYDKYATRTHWITYEMPVT